MGRGGGQVVSVLTFYLDDPSSNPAEGYSFSVTLVFEKKENKQKRDKGWPSKIQSETQIQVITVRHVKVETKKNNSLNTK